MPAGTSAAMAVTTMNTTWINATTFSLLYVRHKTVRCRWLTQTLWRLRPVAMGCRPSPRPADADPAGAQEPATAMPTVSIQRKPVGRTFRIAIASAGVALGAGCASVAPQHAESVTVDVPPAWSVENTTAGVASLVRWWLRFDDPLLGTLVAQALQANTSVRSAQAALAQARALRDVVAAGLMPALDSSASARAQRSAVTAPAASFVSVWTQVGSLMSSAPIEARSTPATPRRWPAPPVSVTCRCRSPPKSHSSTSRCALRRCGWPLPKTT